MFRSFPIFGNYAGLLGHDSVVGVEPIPATGRKVSHNSSADNPWRLEINDQG